MMHPHGWIRHSCTRLLGLYFSKRNVDKAIEKILESKQSNTTGTHFLLFLILHLLLIINYHY